MVKTFGTKYKSEKLGQHLLVDKNVLNDIIKAADIKKNDIILEVGPGTGNLTSLILEKAKKVIAVEKDKDAIKYLNAFFPQKNFILYEDDILKFNIEKEIKDRYKVVANIPYYLTGNLIRSFLERENKPESITILVQKEVAERIVAKKPNSNLLATSVNFFGKPKYMFSVSAKSFSPPPRVESAVIKIDKIQKQIGIDEKSFFRLVKVAFSSPRKKMVNNISTGLGQDKESILGLVKSMGFSEGVRPQELSVDDFKKLYYEVNKK